MGLIHDQKKKWELTNNGTVKQGLKPSQYPEEKAINAELKVDLRLTIDAISFQRKRSACLL